MVGGMNVVLIKRDARLIDHEPLTTAASCHQLPLLILYVYDVCQLRCDTYHESHHQFINEGLMELNSKVQSIAGAGGGSLTFRTGCTADVLKDLHSRVPIVRVISKSPQLEKVSFGTAIVPTENCLWVLLKMGCVKEGCNNLPAIC